MRYLLIVFLLSLQANAEKVFLGNPLNCENLEWFSYQYFNNDNPSLTNNDEFKKEFCASAKNYCKENIDSENSQLRFSSTIGYAFTFHKPICDNKVDYVRATKYYYKAFTKPNGEPSNDLNYYNTIMKNLIRDASKNSLNKSYLKKILDIFELRNLKFSKEDLQYQDNYSRIDSFLKHTDYGKGENTRSLDTRFIVDFYKKAAECDWVKGQNDLAKTLIYGTLGGIMNGRPTITNYVEGYKWLLIARANGYAEYNLEWLEKEKLSPTQITEGQDRAFNWQPNCPNIVLQ